MAEGSTAGGQKTVFSAAALSGAADCGQRRERYVDGVVASNGIGQTAMTAIGMFGPFNHLLYAISMMLVSGSQILCGRYIGKDRKQELRNAFSVDLAVSGLISAAIALLMAEPLTRLFFRDPLDPVYGMTVTGLRMLPFCMPFSVVNQAISVYAQIMQKKLFSTVLPVPNGAVHVVRFSFLLIPVIGMTGLYAANLLNGVCCLLVAAVFAASEIRRLPRNLTDLLAFPKGFGVREEDYLEFSVTEEKDVPTVAQRVERFCLDRGVDRRRAVFSGLATEEMAGNFCLRSADLRHWRCLEIRVTPLGEDVMMRLRDNGVSFNPQEEIETKDPCKDVGVQILLDSAKEVQHRMGIMVTRGISQEIRYRNVLGMNVLMIRI